MPFGSPANWGATPEERRRAQPADTLLDGPVAHFDRAITVHAPAALAYRWLCQISVAPYSYDLLDNWGRRSPSTLTPGAGELAPGDKLIVFELTEVEPGYQLTGRTFAESEKVFGQVAATYSVEPIDERSCRMLCRIIVTSKGFRGRLKEFLLGWGDLVMMRKQLLTLKRYAERDARLGHVS
ncbi:hypothetical protein [Amycolatopsis sp. TNS106]|uniref:hypothetical protein n=1 Tax=Amycolatopsis sp. TNS106 TaxID=2861750 RepID=UPI001C5607AB|nr:hypothetical protein [Amycolatopsis sp. TNS106]QXV59153.1 hypothetical protein CVV72_20580 [Amycolatopsis sp. TNS106]